MISRNTPSEAQTPRACAGVFLLLTLVSLGSSTINFPFTINYTTSYDSDLSVLQDIAKRCGFLGGAEQQLKVNYKVKTEVRVIAVSIGPS